MAAGDEAAGCGKPKTDDAAAEKIGKIRLPGETTLAATLTLSVAIASAKKIIAKKQPTSPGIAEDARDRKKRRIPQGLRSKNDQGIGK